MLFGILLGLLPYTLRAQHAGLRMQVADSLTVQEGVVSLDIQLGQLDSLAEFKGHLLLTVPSGMQALQGDRIAIDLPAGKRRFLSLKFRVSAIGRLKGQSIGIKVADQQGTVTGNRRIGLLVAERRSVVLQDQSATTYFKSTGDSIALQIAVINNGTTDEPVRLVFTSPNRTGNREFNVVSMLLKASADSVIQFRIPVERYMLELPQYTVNVAGLYESSEVFGNLSILTGNLTSSRNFQRIFDQNLVGNVYSRNYIEGMVSNLLMEQQMYYLRSRGEYAAADGILRYEVHMNQAGGRQFLPNINNTYLAYEGNGWGTTLGNIQENTEVSIFGRGIKVYTLDSLSRATATVGVVEKSADLLGAYNLGSPGYTAYGQLTLGRDIDELKSYDGLLYYDLSRYDSTQSLLFTNQFGLLPERLQEKIRLDGFVGAGVQTYYGHEHGTTDSIQPSGALGIRLVGQQDKWSYSSDNFYSTPYYTGNRRGSIQVQQRVSRRYKNYQLGASYIFNKFAPQYISSRMAPFENEISKADIFVSAPLSAFVNVSLQPSYSTEKGSVFLGSENARITKRGWELATTATLRSPNFKHSLFTQFQMGLIQISDRIPNQFAFRSNLTYTYKRLNLYGSYQHGAFQVYELYNSLLFNIPFRPRYGMGTAFNGKALQDKLTWNVNVSASISSDYGHTYAGNSNLSYKLGKNTMLTSLLQYNYTKAVSGFSYDFANLQLGIRQNLKSRDLTKKRPRSGDLDIFCFYDNNGNGIFDKGDEIAADYTLLVDNIVFITNKKGHAQFRKVPYGNYTLFFPPRDNYQAASQKVVLAEGNLQVTVPLQQLSKVTGAIDLQIDANLSLEVNQSLRGYRVLAKNEEGVLTEALTDEAGEFTFLLPAGNYSFLLEETSLPENVYLTENLQLATVQIGENTRIPSFELKVKMKKVEIKRFGTK
ncbi:hypothetical protein C4F40_00985 [Sphingobacterium sp. Ka21]|uniref:SD-repeat containing protein B domain-containing protein n=1 Tax=Sphingobacterium pedocola TaxID=2082722 RepID=A0ABR9T1U5_9SPHI|nr:hypothetical protein [Sphingobacterium pedocola]